MAEKDYSTQDVIEALAAEDFTEEQIRILVPILAYESRVGSKPFVLSAKDSESPSYGLGQANVTTMESAIWMAINETGGEIPGATDQQLRQWKASGHQQDEEDVRDFTPEQEEYAIDYIKNADLTFHAKLVRHMFHQKEQETNDTFETALPKLYVFTPMKFDVNNTDFTNFSEKDAAEAQKFQEIINNDVNSYYESGPTTTTTTTVPPTTTTTTVPPTDDGEEERVLEATPGEQQQYESQVGPAVAEEVPFDEAMIKTDIARGNSPSGVQINGDYKPTKKETFLKYFDTVTSFKKPDPTKFKARKVDEQIQFPSGRPVNIEEVLDLLEP